MEIVLDYSPAYANVPALEYEMQPATPLTGLIEFPNNPLYAVQYYWAYWRYVQYAEWRWMDYMNGDHGWDYYYQWHIKSQQQTYLYEGLCVPRMIVFAAPPLTIEQNGAAWTNDPLINPPADMTIIEQGRQERIQQVEFEVFLWPTTAPNPHCPARVFYYNYWTLPGDPLARVYWRGEIAVFPAVYRRNVRGRLLVPSVLPHILLLSMVLSGGVSPAWRRKQ